MKLIKNNFPLMKISPIHKITLKDKGSPTQLKAYFLENFIKKNQFQKLNNLLRISKNKSKLTNNF